MNKDKATAEVSVDGKYLTCRSADGRLRWTKSVPSTVEWLSLAKHPVPVDLKAGRFQYVGDENNGVIIAVFTPGGSLDFNLIYTANAGDLIRIHEAR